ncbi:MAG: transposase [Planctomycetota bacterium]|nr:transposase [Planctomycetota bacterium]
MPRSARLVIPGLPHHVVQRAARGKALFFTDADRRRYLDLLAGYAAAHRLRIWAWCLLPDHVHLVAVPEKAGSLAAALTPLEIQYSRHIHRTQKKGGVLWRGRYASCPMDETHTWEAVRYVERNPLRAGLILRPDRYGWSSAAGHTGLRKDPLLSGALESRGVVKNWAEWLRAGEDAALVETIRLCTRTGRPAGDKKLIARIEKLTGRSLRPEKR